MRRTRFILAFLAIGIGVTLPSRPVTAHFCSFPAEVKVGEPVTLNVGVAAEEKPVREVDITIPDGFTVEESFGYLGYVGEVNGNKIHFEGAEIAPGTCHYFGVAGEATKKGKLVAPIVTTAPDGTKTRFNDPDPASLYPAMVIFSGIPMVAATEDDDGGSNPTLYAGIGLTVAAAVGGAVLLFLRRRGTMGR